MTSVGGRCLIVTEAVHIMGGSQIGTAPTQKAVKRRLFGFVLNAETNFKGNFF